MAETVLSISHLTKRFDDQTILEDLSLEIREGEVVVIVGSSGCGKSTLLRCINALADIQGGEIRLRGDLISHNRKNLPELRQKIGMVFQNYELCPHLTVLENILLAPVKTQKRSRQNVREEALALLERVGLKEKADSWPRQLSGGQKQRVAIVRALIMHPEILLFDEVTAALDPEMVSEVLNVVIDLARGGMTMAIVTHEMRFAEAVADRVLFLEEGVVLEEGTPEKFFHAPTTERAQRFLQSFTYASKRDKNEIQPKNNFGD